jgi:hypothetical protein
MNTPDRIVSRPLAVAVAGAAVVASLAWMAVAQEAPAVSRSPPGASPAGTGDKLVVCVASDSVLHAATDRGCGAGAMPLAIERADKKSLNCLDCGADPSAPPGLPNDALAQLVSRLDKLRQSSLFTVVDPQGRPIFAVAPQRAILYNPAGAALAVISATANGGFFTGRSANGSPSVTVGASDTSAGVRISEEGVPYLDLGTLGSGTYALRFPSLKSSGEPLAAIGESRAGTGALVVSDLTGSRKATMTIADGKGALDLYNGDGTAVVSLTEGASAGGLLAIGDGTGEPMVKMGVKDDRYGVVLTGPRAGFPLVPKSGLPGSYFLGCAGGEGCVP